MEDQVPEEIKTKRSARLISLADEMSKEFRDYYIGRTEEVLFEEANEIDGKLMYTGYTREYVKVAAESEVPLDNCMRKGKITESSCNFWRFRIQ
jgi:threonylcarbamoyladenosine tRNA methylthiotransferase MtaB